ncbi:ubiquinol--cytochrome-c reductase subunit 8, variant 2 [Basidiobolus ranarum]|uniref:Cytochrome b-c1 complex subunit 8 n=1 Tax=Basidiobolus ranarum TaxID=34480 RepID=A0ABR2W8J7_9FUNG
MGGGKWMGNWGHLGGPTQRGIISYSLSPNEQRAFAGVLKNGLFKTYRRFVSQIPWIAPGALIFYTVYTWGVARHEYLNSKAGAHERE